MTIKNLQIGIDMDNLLSNLPINNLNYRKLTNLHKFLSASNSSALIIKEQLAIDLKHPNLVETVDRSLIQFYKHTDNIKYDFEKQYERDMQEYQTLIQAYGEHNQEAWGIHHSNMLFWMFGMIITLATAGVSFFWFFEYGIALVAILLFIYCSLQAQTSALQRNHINSQIEGVALPSIDLTPPSLGKEDKFKVAMRFTQFMPQTNLIASYIYKKYNTEDAAFNQFLLEFALDRFGATAMRDLPHFTPLYENRHDFELYIGDFINEAYQVYSHRKS